MLNLRLSEIAVWCQGRLLGTDTVVGSVATDTRKVQRGDLFVALKGERVDAHDFLELARSAGAVAALVARKVDSALAQIVVADTERALGDLAAAVRARLAARVVGITGSNGKTTVKTLAASILALQGRTHFNAGNYNNEIGLPLTLLAMPADTEFAVLEMGAGKPGDIAYLAAIARPQVGLVNNIAPAHLERLHSLDGVAETKGALLQALPADGVAVINAEDGFAALFGAMAGTRRVLRFGFSPECDVWAAALELGTRSRFVLHTPQGSTPVELALAGRHNVSNALAAAAIAHALDVPLAHIRAGLEQTPAVAGRLDRRDSGQGWTLIDDSYNANPGSAIAAIDTLVLQPGEPWLVLGDMKELGADALALHARIGTHARDLGVARLYATGPLAQAAAGAFGAQAYHFTTQSELIARLRRDMHAGVCCLVKGSRSSAMDKVVAALLATEGDSHAA
ncbi:UDP-N-acetylmuramoyl-tripeptide--D-alanyl-D-alanine ligase [Tahibacter aquaticus]|uniref:UDP-N-acetylmuramoyl-tripeptide--D-alanyl-D-alanine ligase n=1 Tax=Tahibacter aquaticus TaxID=520092 RepID=A0A4R6ZAK1_9GAMM|nr:UDP-N-acetylmuramoyl-tripeptide--D-alanyl-D-alanine ligase [Tahibacter aquaticus]TDR48729.1 UDP-N-acetylmuramoyl-tripeptide--D-alanyl-D-alanine ligase [Tahibacter aquaticus]